MTSETIEQTQPEEMLPLRVRLKADLLAAMKAREGEASTILRTVLAAIDNAEAVPLSEAPVAVAGRTNDVPRLVLTETQMHAIVQREADDLCSAIAQYERLAQDAKATQLRVQLARIAPYLEP